MPAADLQLQLECELPDAVAIGRGTALFVCGWCFHREARIRALSFIVDGETQPVMAHGMPRLDPFRALHPDLDVLATDGLSADPGSPEDPGLHSYRSGFWGVVRIAPRASGTLTLSLGAELDDGRTAGVEVAQLPVTATMQSLAPAWPESDRPAVVICMATYNPPEELLRRQLDSIRAQTHPHWTCVISDDCSGPQGSAALTRAVGDDPRFVVSRSAQRLGFYRNFERALTMVAAGADYVVLSDQDDAWHPDKLATLLSAIGPAQLVYSDARVVSRTGELISETWWGRRRNNHSDLLSLLVANAVTGAASLFRRDLLDSLLPFPPAQFAHFHDHWLGLVALALGDIAYVDRPLYDYVQHGEASLGHAAANQMTGLRDRLTERRALRDRARMWRLHYFVDVCRLMQFGTILQMRCGPRMSPVKRRSLDRFLRAERSVPSLGALALRGARELVGTPETLGAEWMLFHAFAWRRLLELSVSERPRARLRLDALPPPSLVSQPGRTGLHETARVIVDKIAPLRWRVADDAPQRTNILIPTIDLRHFFGGYIAKFNLARRLVEAGERVRIVTVDPVGPLPGDWRRSLESYGGLDGLLDRVEVVFGRESSGIELSRRDRVVATTWWTAHVARQAMELLAGERFLYLIQEYEPFTFAMGSYAALAQESYGLAHFALFSSELLRDYFRRHAIGVFAAGGPAGDAHSASFQNAITAVDPPTAGELGAQRPRRLLFYARPEPHAARNMFELGAMALATALAEGAFQGGWELHGIGTVERGRKIALGGGASLDLLPRSAQSAYADVLRQHDVGLALMYTPHPSLVPIEMASAGMLTVTNSFENKTPEAMAAISQNLITAAPTVEGVAAGLLQAAAGVGDVDRRVAGSATDWSRDWNQSFDDAMIARLIGALDRDGAATA